MNFQILSWLDEDVEGDEEDTEYNITVFGKMENGQSVTLQIKNPPVYFYIMIPSDQWDTYDIDKLKKFILFSYKDGINSIELVNKIPLYPFTNQTRFRFLQINFRRKITFYCIRKIFRSPVSIKGISLPSDYIFKTAESKLDPFLRLGHIQDIRTAGWIQVNNYEKNNISPHSDHDITCQSTDISPYLPNNEEYPEFAPFTIMSWDIEAYSSKGRSHGALPDPNQPQDTITQIGATIWTFPTTKKKYILNWFDTEGIHDDITEIKFTSERDMLNGFCEFVAHQNPDIILGYNTWGFDDMYLYTRMKLLGILPSIQSMSRTLQKDVTLEDKVLSSSAYGHNEFKILQIPGRLSFDMLVSIRKEHKLPKYSLNFVSQHFLDDSKDDITPYQLFQIIEEKIPHQVAKVCNYCVQDTDLVIRLMEKLCILTNFVEMAKSTRVPVDWLLTRGQQCKVYSQLAYETRKIDYVIMDRDEPPLTYKGATVLTAQSGAYFEPVIGLDFKSLYPSIMIDYNMCYSTLVTEEKYMGIHGVTYKSIEWQEDTTKHKYTYVQNIPGVLPVILSRLWDERNQAKRKMKQHQGTFLEKVYDGQQLAIKVTMNSIYGFTGSDNGMQSCKPIAASVTAKGREMIQETSNIANQLTNCVTVYGDSVTPDTPIILRKNGKIFFSAIQDITPDNLLTWQDYPGFKPNSPTTRTHKQKAIPDTPLETWDGTRWTPIRKIIRHKVNKTIHSIHTQNSYVEVTEDHSLITHTGELIKPSNTCVGDMMMTGYPKLKRQCLSIQDILSWSPITLIEKKVVIFGILFDRGTRVSENHWKVSSDDTLLSCLTDVGYQFTCSGNFVYISNRAITPNLTDSNGKKKIPNFIVNTRAHHVPFISTLVKSQQKSGPEFICISIRNQVSSAAFFYILKHFLIYFTLHSPQQNKFIFSISDKYINYKEGQVTKNKTLTILPNFVYDLETESGIFLAGIGNIIVKNTDSCYIKPLVNPKNFPTQQEYLQEIFNIGHMVADHITKHYQQQYAGTMKKPRRELEMEKIMFPLILFSKKRYAFQQWTNPNTPDDLEIKGISIKRRDFCKFVKDTGMNILKIVLQQRNIPEAVEYTTKRITDLLEDRVPTEQLVISKALNKSYTVDGKKVLWDDTTHLITSQPHVAIARRLKEMNHNIAPPQRIPYVFVMTKNESALQCDRTEHPDYLGSKKIDARYYFDTQLKNTVQFLFELLIPDPEALYKQAYINRTNKDKKNTQITNYFQSSHKPRDNKEKTDNPTTNKPRQELISSFFTKK